MADAGREAVEAVRRFNRFYTQKIGVLHEHLLKSPFSLTESRVLYELAHHDTTTAAALGRELGLDAGYLSRILQAFRKQRLVEKTPSRSDARQSLLALTAKGRQAFAPLDEGSRAEVGALLRPLSLSERGRLLGALRTVERLLGGAAQRDASYLIRPHQPGDIGFVIHRHGALYAQEFGWDESFEALVAEIAGRFLRRFDARRECCFIVEKDGAVVGSVFLVKRSASVAQLRLLLVEPEARGLGIGKRLVDECVRFATRVGYRKLMLWTQKNLDAARRIYEGAGFRRVRQERHQSFGHDLVAEIWERSLV
jgi:DNA-binding MarR family transcriptional regulator/GNAT superfamily N-acetyltransferase